MKYLLFILLLLPLTVLAQVKVDTFPDGSYIVKIPKDSTDIKLQHYKDLFTQGLITAPEYEALKAKLLGLQTKQVEPQKIIVEQAKPKMNEYQIQTLRAHGRTNVVVGVLFVPAGIGLFVGMDKLLINQPEETGAIVVCGLFGGILTVASLPLIITGSIKVGRANHYARQLALNIKPDRLGLAFNF